MRAVPISEGTRIIKVKGEDGDLNPVGTEGTVVSSLFDAKFGDAYLIEWDTYPGVSVFVIGWKIAEA